MTGFNGVSDYVTIFGSSLTSTHHPRLVSNYGGLVEWASLGRLAHVPYFCGFLDSPEALPAGDAKTEVRTAVDPGNILPQATFSCGEDMRRWCR